MSGQPVMSELAKKMAAVTLSPVSTMETALAAIQSAGWAVVPAEITEEMQYAYFQVIDKNFKRVETDARFGRYSNNALAYKAMIAASPAKE